VELQASGLGLQVVVTVFGRRWLMSVLVPI